MFLIKLKLKLDNSSAKWCIMNCQKMHQHLMDLFSMSRKEAGVLYRFDIKNHVLYVLSSVWPQIHETSMFKVLGLKPVDDIISSFVVNSCFSFNLLTYPYKTNFLTGKKTSIRDEDGIAAWLERKGRQHGFSVLSQNVFSRITLFGSHKKDKGGDFYIPAVEIMGILKITDVEKFRQAFSCGIGSGKAYGLGMLLLRRM